MLCCALANISAYEFGDFTLQKVQAGYGLCVPVEAGAHPSKEYTSPVQTLSLPSSAASTAASGKLGALPQLVRTSSSAYSCCGEGRFGDVSLSDGETSLPLQADLRSYRYGGGKSWMQSQEPACQSPLKGRIAGWMSPLSAPLRKASYSSESDQLS